MTQISPEDAPFQRSHWKLVSGATAGYISDGYTLGVVGIALAAAQSQLHLTSLWLSLIASSSLAGLFLGALVSGWAADRYGRRPIYAYNMVAFVGLSLLQLVVDSPAQLWIVRFLLGLVLGTDYVVCKALLAECIPRLSRGRCLSLMGVAWAVGYALAYIVGMYAGDAWRWTLASAAIPALISVPLRLGTPESLAWLTRQKPENSRSLKVLFTPQHRRATLVASTLFFCLVVPYFAVSTFIPQVMAALQVTGNRVAGLIYILGLMFGSIAGFLVVDWLPRRVFVIGSFVVTSVALLLSSTTQGSSVVLSFAVFSCVLSAAQAQIYVYLPELFPTSLRASGLGVAVAVSRLGAAAGTFLLPLCMEHLGANVGLSIYTATLIAGGIVAFRWAPETRRIHLTR